MSRVFVCLFVLSILNIAVRFGACENNTIPDTEDECEDVKITPGSDETRLSSLEKTLRRLMLPIDAVGNIIGKDEGSFGKVLEKFSDYIHVIYPGNSIICNRGTYRKNTVNAKNEYLRKIFLLIFKNKEIILLDVYKRIYIGYFKCF